MLAYAQQFLCSHFMRLYLPRAHLRETPELLIKSKIQYNGRTISLRRLRFHDLVPVGSGYSFPIPVPQSLPEISPCAAVIVITYKCTSFQSTTTTLPLQETTKLLSYCLIRITLETN